MTVLLRRLLLAVVFMAVPLAMWPGAARADTVASLLGDFTINQYTGIELASGEVKLHYVAVFGQLPALRELREADANADGVTSQAERDAHVQKLAPGIAEQLSLSVGGVAVPLRALRWASSLPTEQGGFSMRLDIDFAGALPAAASDQPQTLNFENRNYPGKIGWHEIAVSASPGVAVFDTNAFSTSLTAGLTEALKELPATGPLDERSVHLQFVTGAAPAGAQAIQARAGTAATLAAGASAATTASTEHSPVAGAAPGSAVSPWLQTQTRRLIDIISAPHVPPHILVIALLAAMVLGALHAFAPGHGKTIVGAYLVGSRGTPRHAVFLGVTVTITHTLIVFALGLVTLFASQFILPEKVFPILSLLSGLLVFGMGIVLLAQRWRGLAGGHGHDHVHPHPHPHPHDHGHGHGGHAHEHGAHGHAAHSHDAAHSHGHDHGHPHDAVAGAMHSHGGAMHSHLPPVTPGEAVSWRGLLALGVSGGLLPCPSAMVLLLAAVALHKTFYGLLLVVAFSVGLALTLTAVGLAFLYARNRFAGSLGDARWVQVLPVLSAALITGLGAVLCYGALAAGPV